MSTYDRTHLQRRHRELLEIAAEDTDACSVWTHANYNGYGMFGLNKKVHRTHVYVCEMYHGPRPTPSHEVAHNCGVRACVNPRHLRWATRSENHLDKRDHGTMVAGEKHPFVKYSDAEIRLIRALHAGGVRAKELAEAFGMTTGHTSRILKGKARTDA